MHISLLIKKDGFIYNVVSSCILAGSNGLKFVFNLMDLLKTCRFSLHMILTDVRETYGSLVDYCDAFNQLFKLSV